MEEWTLRPWQPEDREALTALVGRVDRTYLSSRLPAPFTDDCARTWLRQAAERDGKRGVYRAILLDGRLAGSVSAEMQDFPEAARDANLSCFLAPEACGRGGGQLAVAAITELAFRQLPVVRLSAWICAENRPSCRCAEKAGFTREALLRKADAHGDRDRDLCIYGKLREEQ